MNWKIYVTDEKFLVARTSPYSASSPAVDVRALRVIEHRGSQIQVEVYAECATIELAERILTSLTPRYTKQ